MQSMMEDLQDRNTSSPAFRSTGTSAAAALLLAMLLPAVPAAAIPAPGTAESSQDPAPETADPGEPSVATGVTASVVAAEVAESAEAAEAGAAGVAEDGKSDVSILEDVPVTEDPVTGEKIQRTPGGVTEVVLTQDGEEWRDDEERGTRYRLVRLPMARTPMKWDGEDNVRLPGGMRVKVEKHDDQWLYFRLYEVLKRPVDPERKAAPKSQAPEPSEVTAAIEELGATTESADRLSFEPFDNGLPRAGQWRNQFDVADMNDDGELDLVFGPVRKGYARPNIFLGDGQGGWQHWAARFPRQPYDYGAAAAADFNRDGHMDLALGVHLRGMLVLVGDGQGGFEPWTEGIGLIMPGRGNTANAFSSRGVRAVDWNGDGWTDLLALGEGPKGMQKGRSAGGRGALMAESRGFLLYANQGDGTWIPQIVEEEPYDFGDKFVVADFDGDKKHDIAVANRRLGSRTILRVGRGEHDLLKTGEIDIRPDSTTFAVADGDFDGDGRTDLVVSYLRRDLSLWFDIVDLFTNRKKGWERHTLIARVASLGGTTALGTGDLDGDGHLDLVALSGAGEVQVFLGDGAGSMIREESPELPEPVRGCTGWDVHLVDLDRDGAAELLASFAGEPTGLATIAAMNIPGCPNQGYVKVWKARPVAGDREMDAESSAATPDAGS